RITTTSIRTSSKMRCRIIKTSLLLHPNKNNRSNKTLRSRSSLTSRHHSKKKLQNRPQPNKLVVQRARACSVSSVTQPVPYHCQHNDRGASQIQSRISGQWDHEPHSYRADGNTGIQG